MNFIEQAQAWLGPDAAYGLVTLSALLLAHVWRSVHLKSWDRFVALFPKPDTRGLKLALHRLVQGWPALAFGAVIGAVSGGEDLKTALKSAAAGALASLLVIFRQYGAEWLSTFKLPPGGPGAAAIVMALCLSCTPQWQAQRHVAAAVENVTTQAIYPTLERAYEAAGVEAISVSQTRDEALQRVEMVERQWAPIWFAYNSLVAAHTAWIVALESAGDPVVAADAVHEAYCELRKVSAEHVPLPDFPGPGLGCP